MADTKSYYYCHLKQKKKKNAFSSLHTSIALRDEHFYLINISFAK